MSNPDETGLNFSLEGLTLEDDSTGNGTPATEDDTTLDFNVEGFEAEVLETGEETGAPEAPAPTDDVQIKNAWKDPYEGLTIGEVRERAYEEKLAKLEKGLGVNPSPAQLDELERETDKAVAEVQANRDAAGQNISTFIKVFGEERFGVFGAQTLVDSEQYKQMTEIFQGEVLPQEYFSLVAEGELDRSKVSLEQYVKEQVEIAGPAGENWRTGGAVGDATANTLWSLLAKTEGGEVHEGFGLWALRMLNVPEAILAEGARTAMTPLATGTSWMLDAAGDLTGFTSFNAQAEDIAKLGSPDFGEAVAKGYGLPELGGDLAKALPFDELAGLVGYEDEVENVVDWTGWIVGLGASFFTNPLDLLASGTAAVGKGAADVAREVAPTLTDAVVETVEVGRQLGMHSADVRVRQIASETANVTDAESRAFSMSAGMATDASGTGLERAPGGTQILEEMRASAGDFEEIVDELGYSFDKVFALTDEGYELGEQAKSFATDFLEVNAKLQASNPREFIRGLRIADVAKRTAEGEFVLPRNLFQVTNRTAVPTSRANEVGTALKRDITFKTGDEFEQGKRLVEGDELADLRSQRVGDVLEGKDKDTLLEALGINAKAFGEAGFIWSRRGVLRHANPMVQQKHENALRATLRKLSDRTVDEYMVLHEKLVDDMVQSMMDDTVKLTVRDGLVVDMFDMFADASGRTSFSKELSSVAGKLERGDKRASAKLVRSAKSFGVKLDKDEVNSFLARTIEDHRAQRTAASDAGVLVDDAATPLVTKLEDFVKMKADEQGVSIDRISALDKTRRNAARAQSANRAAEAKRASKGLSPMTDLDSLVHKNTYRANVLRRAFNAITAPVWHTKTWVSKLADDVDLAEELTQRLGNADKVVTNKLQRFSREAVDTKTTLDKVVFDWADLDHVDADFAQGLERYVRETFDDSSEALFEHLVVRGFGDSPEIDKAVRQARSNAESFLLRWNSVQETYKGEAATRPLNDLRDELDSMPTLDRAFVELFNGTAGPTEAINLRKVDSRSLAAISKITKSMSGVTFRELGYDVPGNPRYNISMGNKEQFVQSLIHTLVEAEKAAAIRDFSASWAMRNVNEFVAVDPVRAREVSSRLPSTVRNSVSVAIDATRKALALDVEELAPTQYAGEGIALRLQREAQDRVLAGKEAEELADVFSNMVDVTKAEADAPGFRESLGGRGFRLVDDEGRAVSDGYLDYDQYLFEKQRAEGPEVPEYNVVDEVIDDLGEEGVLRASDDDFDFQVINEALDDELMPDEDKIDFLVAFQNISREEAALRVERHVSRARDLGRKITFEERLVEKDYGRLVDNSAAEEKKIRTFGAERSQRAANVSTSDAYRAVLARIVKDVTDPLANSGVPVIFDMVGETRSIDKLAGTFNISRGRVAEVLKAIDDSIMEAMSESDELRTFANRALSHPDTVDRLTDFARDIVENLKVSATKSPTSLSESIDDAASLMTSDVFQSSLLRSFNLKGSDGYQQLKGLSRLGYNLEDNGFAKGDIDALEGIVNDLRDLAEMHRTELPPTRPVFSKEGLQRKGEQTSKYIQENFISSRVVNTVLKGAAHVINIGKAGYLFGFWAPNASYYAMNLLSAPTIALVTRGPRTAWNAGADLAAYLMLQVESPFRTVGLFSPQASLVKAHHDANRLAKALSGHPLEEGATVTIAGRARKVDEVIDELMRFGIDETKVTSDWTVLSAPNYDDLVNRVVTDMGGRETGAARYVEGIFRKGTTGQSIWGEFANRQDRYFRVREYIRALDEGETPIEASRRARDLLLDYSKLTDVEKQFFSKAFAVYAFPRVMAMTALRATLDNPSRIYQSFRLQEASPFLQEEDEQDVRVAYYNSFRADRPIVGRIAMELGEFDVRSSFGETVGAGAFFGMAEIMASFMNGGDSVVETAIKAYMNSAAPFIKAGNLVAFDKQFAFGKALDPFGKIHPRRVAVLKASGMFEAYAKDIYKVEAEEGEASIDGFKYYIKKDKRAEWARWDAGMVLLGVERNRNQFKDWAGLSGVLNSVGYQPGELEEAFPGALEQIFGDEWPRMQAAAKAAGKTLQATGAVSVEKAPTPAERRRRQAFNVPR